MQRYFGKLDPFNHVILGEDDIFHLTKVMRARIGQHIEVVIEQSVYDVVIENLHPFQLKLGSKIEQNNELLSDITLYYGLPKGDKIDLVLQKATELGVSKFVLLMSKRSLVRIEDKDKTRKLERFQKIIKEASEQSKRNSIPTILDIGDFALIHQAKGSLRLIADELMAGSTNHLNDYIDQLPLGHSIDLLIGPEGGFERSEVQEAIKCGFTPIALGKRILRSETAVLYLLSVVSNSLERK